MKNTGTITTELKHVQQQMQEYLQKHWRLFLFEGIVFILLGSAAIVVPQFFSVVIVIFLGWLVVLGGMIHLSRAFLFANMPGFGLWLVSGILQVIVGYLLIVDPIAGVMSITMMMALFFVLEGTIKIYWAFMLRPLPQWRFVLFSGVTSLLFTVIILTFWSQTEYWLLGVFVGVNMVFLGWSMVKMSLYHKDNDKNHELR